MEYAATNLTSKYTLVGKEVNEIMVGPGEAGPSQIVKSIMDDYGLKQIEAEKYVEETLNIVKA